MSGLFEQATAQDELLPCPFCNGEPNLTHGDYVHDDLSPMPVVECKSCSAWVRAEDWNRRPAQTAPQPELVMPVALGSVSADYDKGWSDHAAEVRRLNAELLPSTPC
jgi:hypothetical protein